VGELRVLQSKRAKLVLLNPQLSIGLLGNCGWPSIESTSRGKPLAERALGRAGRGY
jgi:hypothetical protein